MKIVTAVVAPFVLEPVRDALEAGGVQGMTVSEVQHPARVRVEVLVDDGDHERVLDLLVAAAGSGAVDDARVWSSPVSGAVRVRTGERGAGHCDVEAL